MCVSPNLHQPVVVMARHVAVYAEFVAAAVICDLPLTWSFVALHGCAFGGFDLKW